MSAGLHARWPRAASRLAAVVPEDLPRALLSPGDDVPALLTRMHAGAVRGRATVHVVQLTEPSACDIGIEMVVAGELAGDALRHADTTPDAPPPEPDALTGRVLPPGVVAAGELVSLRRPRFDGRALAALRGAQGAVLVVDTAHVRPRDLALAVDMLTGLDVALLGLVVWAGRIPKDPNWALSASRRDAGQTASMSPLAALPPGPAAPAEAAPVEAAPVEAAPVEAAPVEAAPVEAAPVEAAPNPVAPAEVGAGDAAPAPTPRRRRSPATRSRNGSSTSAAANG